MAEATSVRFIPFDASPLYPSKVEMDWEFEQTSSNDIVHFKCANDSTLNKMELYLSDNFTGFATLEISRPERTIKATFIINQGMNICAIPFIDFQRGTLSRKISGEVEPGTFFPIRVAAFMPLEMNVEENGKILTITSEEDLTKMFHLLVKNHSPHGEFILQREGPLKDRQITVVLKNENSGLAIHATLEDLLERGLYSQIPNEREKFSIYFPLISARLRKGRSVGAAAAAASDESTDSVSKVYETLKKALLYLDIPPNFSILDELMNIINKDSDGQGTVEFNFQISAEEFVEIPIKKSVITPLKAALARLKEEKKGA